MPRIACHPSYGTACLAIVAAMPTDAGLREPRHVGRPRSEQARRAVLEAVDDLLVDVGYAAMTMKGIAERAGVGRQTVYRWWSTKAEILVEACATDAEEELTTQARPDPVHELLSYLTALTAFLTTSPAGLAYRALVGEAQHDPAVADLVRRADLLTPSAGRVLDRVRPHAAAMPDTVLAAAQLSGPVLSQVLAGVRPLRPRQLKEHVTGLLTAWN
jgi:AcrR family transcriptional regulator